MAAYWTIRHADPAGPRGGGYREKNSFTRYRVPANRARSSFERTYVTSPFREELMTNLIPGPALMVRRESSDVSVSFIEPMIFQESDCAFTAFDHRSISNNHSPRLKEKELRKGVATPSNATLLFDASTSESTTVTISSSIPAFRNFATMSSWTRACSGEVKTEKLTVSTSISP